MKITKILLLTFSLAFLAFVTESVAQDATVQATGTVLQPLGVIGSNLNFGLEIFPGINEVVERTDANASQFDVTGENGKEITATFTLPENMEDGENALTISFSVTDGGHATSSTDQGSANSFNPSSPLTTNLSAEGELFIWLGGTVEPAADQSAGSYTADITLETVYTGE